MNTAETIAAITGPAVLVLAGLMTLAAAREWLSFSVSVSLRVNPASKRQPRSAAEMVQVVPAAVVAGAEIKDITTAREPAA